MVDVCLLVAGFIIGSFIRWLWSRGKKPACPDAFCEATPSADCSDGRCRFHCQVYCMCERRQVAKPAKLIAFPGGKR